VGAELASDHRNELREVLADEGDLLGRGEVEVDRPEQVGEGLGVRGGGIGEEAEDALGGALVGAVPGEGAETQQAEGGGGIARGDRVVAYLLAAGDQRFVVGGSGEEATTLVVGEASEQGGGELVGALEPDGLEARFIEREQRLSRKAWSSR